METSIQPKSGATPADIDRNGRPTSFGTGGRLQAGITGRLRRNAQRFLAILAILGTVAFFAVRFHSWEANGQESPIAKERLAHPEVTAEIDTTLKATRITATFSP